jgi:DNA-binding transcriptional LysR family regulator
VAFARQQLMPLLTEFLQSHPEVRIELDMADRLRSLATEGFDLAIRHTDRAPDTHVAWTLCESRSVLVATKTYLRRHGTPSTPHDLTQHNCLHYPRAQETPVWSFTPHHKLPKLRLAPGSQKRGHSGLQSDAVISVPIRGALAANNSEALREAAMASAGIALLPDFSAQAALRKGQLVVVLPQWQVDGGFGKNIFAIRPYTPHVPRAVSALVAHLRTGLADGFDA